MKLLLGDIPERACRVKSIRHTGCHGQQGRGLFAGIRQCVQSYAVHKESLFSGLLVVFYQCCIMTSNIIRPQVKDEHMRVRESMTTAVFRRTDGNLYLYYLVQTLI